MKTLLAALVLLIAVSAALAGCVVVPAEAGYYPHRHSHHHHHHRHRYRR